MNVTLNVSNLLKHLVVNRTTNHGCEYISILKYLIY